MRRSKVAALAFTLVLAVPGLAAASPTPPSQPAAGPAVAVRPADGPGANVVPRAVHMSRATNLVDWIDVQGVAAGRAQAVQALRQKAIALGGDGITDVEFHPGANGEASYYTASAVTFRKRHHHPVAH